MSTTTTTALNYTAPPTFPKADKFDGMNWLQWNKAILISARLQGARGYLEELIVNPAAHPLAAPLPPSPSTTDAPIITTTITLTAAVPLTPWTSTSPSTEEWDTCDAWAMGLITWNVKNTVGLGVKTNRMAAQAWTSLKLQYETTSDLTAVLADTKLCQIKLCDSDDLHTHIANLRSKWAYANSVSAEVLDRDFQIIQLQSLPMMPVWQAFISTLYEAKTAAEVITRIGLHWQHVSETRTIATLNTTTTALQADTKQKKPDKYCTNCHRRGHTADVCYWSGGGKDGQFPPGFGKRGGANGSTNSSTPSTTTPATTANVAMVETAYALMAVMGGWDKDGGTGEHVVSFIPTRDKPTALAAMASGGGELLTYVDSSASDHCFANKNDFSAYEPFIESCEGQAACRGARFKILRKGTVVKVFISEGQKTTITFYNALHTPEFAANLISVSKFDTANFKVIFGEGRARFIDSNSEAFVTANCSNRMYLLSQGPDTAALSVRSHEKPTSIDIWHWQFSHAGVTLIEDMAQKNLVDRLQITGGDLDRAPGMCEDCIYGKQTSRPYDEHYTPETELLALVHIDLWGPA
ncbi:unnamed protein product [Cyclocybe aegerita]|uniref:Retrovirus-related Pol polyprotein from transposon TNT 1-94-like beta-barrel domain-containing protein n=1 Tax=Cyclocybe aegerita TaxID=1973307 RepID=A0A8S0X0J9_CYCAE|nr:unnamed protein product [Cyclocybe aegerita]